MTNVGSAAVSRNGETLDISSSGVLFECVDELQPGERIEFIITLSASVSEVRLRCLGKVLRSEARPEDETSATPASRFDTAVTIDRYHFVRVPRMETVAALA